MDSSFRNDQESSTQQDPKRFLVSLTLLASIIKRLAGLIHLTEEEREDAGIFIDRLGDE
jgi:hypothetical protein